MGLSLRALYQPTVLLAMALMAVIIWSMPRDLITIFLEDTPENARVIALGVSFLAIAAIFQVADGAQVVGAGMLRGLHDTRVPMIFTFIGYWGIGIGVGAWLAFRQGWQGQGIWTGLAPGGGASGVDSTAVGGATRVCAKAIPFGRLARPASVRTQIREYRIMTALSFTRFAPLRRNIECPPCLRNGDEGGFFTSPRP